VYTFTKLHHRCIPKVRVGVGPMEFQLIAVRKHASPLCELTCYMGSHGIYLPAGRDDFLAFTTAIAINACTVLDLATPEGYKAELS